MSDSAKGPLAGYLFQFEKALLLLASLESENDYISIENVDDIASHNENGTVLLTVQAKHSISNSGTTFEDTSYALWRTLQIWIEKLEQNIFDSNTKFICSTNKNIPNTSLLSTIISSSFDQVYNDIQKLLLDQKAKFKELNKTDPTKGDHIKRINNLITFVLSKKDLFEIIKNNLEIHHNENIIGSFFNKIHINSDTYSNDKRKAIYEQFYGWITYGSYAKWKNSTEANFSKKQFNDKLLHVMTDPTIIHAVFRTKELLGTVSDEDIEQKRKELFVKQIEDINRRKDAKERIIKEAILDFILSDIELTYIINEGNYTSKDFDDFINECFKTWQSCFDQSIIKEIEEYREDEKHEKAVQIYDQIMSNIDLKFNTNISFNQTNKYVRNGSFLKLSNIPKIGWAPDWETKYKS